MKAMDGRAPVVLSPSPPGTSDPAMARFTALLLEVLDATWAELDLQMEGSRRPTRYTLGTRGGGSRRMLLEEPGVFRADVRHDGSEPSPGIERLLRFTLARTLSELALKTRLLLVIQALDATSSAVLLFDPEGEIAYANPRAEELLVLQTMGELRVETGPGREEPLLSHLTRLATRLREDDGERQTGHHTFPDGTWIGWELALLAPVPGRSGRSTLCVVRTACPSSRGPLPRALAAFNLTRREREVVEHLLCGLSTREIAERMGISHHTVRDHLKHLFRKTSTRSRRELLELIESSREPGTGFAAPPSPGRSRR